MTTTNSTWRTANVLRQLKGSIGYRAGAMVLSLLAVPIMIAVLGTEQFGVWSTLLSIMSWAVFFDLGIGNGMRNKVTAALAEDNKTEARLYIASGYTMIGLVVVTIWVTLTVISYFVPWQVVFNTTAISENELRQTFQITAFFVLLNFWIGLVAMLFSAVQQTSFVELGRLITNFLVLIFVFALAKTEASSIRSMAVLYGTALVFANLLLSALFFKPRRDLRPTFHLDLQHARPLLTLGSQFFVIQLAVLVIFTTDKILITQWFGAKHVTDYDIVFKIFSLVTIAHGLIMAPLWSAYTDAYKRDDLGWIRQILRMQILVFGGVVVAVGIIAVSTQTIVRLWIGDEIMVSWDLILLMALLTLILTWNNIFGTILAGIGKVRLGSIYTVLTGVINIPLSYYFAVVLGIGVAGIILGTIASIAVSALISPLQVYYFVYTNPSRGLIYSVLR